MKKSRSFCIGLLAALAVSGALAASNSASSSSWHTTPFFHATTPAGYDVLRLKPGDGIISFLGLIECPELEGAQEVGDGTNGRIINADGQVLKNFPQHFSFRITASLRKTVLLDPTESIQFTEDPQELLLKLKFQLKTYHGLNARIVEPDSVQMIGVPADIPYDERVYRVSFTVNNLPVSDRCVLEILSPDGNRLTKFHFDLL
jgi:hypothetical protein